MRQGAGSRFARVHAPAERAANDGRPTSQLAVALQQLCDQLADAQGKLIQLTTIGLEHVPDIQVAAFYDMLSQMLRNAIEHGIETPAQRRAGGKNPRGVLLVEFQLRHGGQSELNFQDDGAGLDAERIVQVAVANGLVTEDSSLEHNRRQASALIFHSGLSTAAEPAGRGLGMRILRDNVKRLHGQIQVATKRGLFTRLRIRLPLCRHGCGCRRRRRRPEPAACGSPLRLTQRVDAEHARRGRRPRAARRSATSAATPPRRTAGRHRCGCCGCASRHSVRR